MLRRLDDASLFERGLPAGWSEIQQGLMRIDEIAASAAPMEERRREAREVYDGLLRAWPGSGDAVPLGVSRGSTAHVRWFLTAALLWERFEEVVEPDEALDTVRSRTLRRYPSDLPADTEAIRHLRGGLCKAFEVEPAALEEMAREVAWRVDNLALKREITRHLRLALTARGLPSPEERVALMRRFYGQVPFRPGEVELVVTASAIFFCVAYRGKELEGEAWASRSEVEREEVRGFLQALHRQNTALTGRFPAFGGFDRSRLDPSLAEELAAAVRGAAGFGHVRAEVVEDTLVTMPSILPTRLLEQYLVHDAWGHVWQEALCDFEGPYARLRHTLDPITPETGPYFGGDSCPPLARAFRDAGGRCELDPALLRSVVEADARGRVVAGITGVLSETLADLVEWKLLHLAKPEEGSFPQSSVLPGAVVKLDLAISDVRQHVRWWRTPYRALDDAAERSRLAEELALRGIPREGLDTAIGDACARMSEWLAPVHDDALGGDGFLPRYLAQLVGLAVELERIVEGVRSYEGPDRWRTPGACVDFLVLLLGTFFEIDRSVMLWHLDELVRDELAPALERLRVALQEV